MGGGRDKSPLFSVLRNRIISQLLEFIYRQSLPVKKGPPRSESGRFPFTHQYYRPDRKVLSYIFPNLRSIYIR